MNIEFEIDGQKYKSFDEEDVILMEEISSHIKENFTSNKFSLPNFNTKIEVGELIDDAYCQEFVNMIDENIGDLYERHKGKDWREEKMIELEEPGLIFIWLTNFKDVIIAYLSFKLCLDDDDVLVLYLFEIHILKEYQNQKIGQQLIDEFHNLVLSLKNSSNKLYQNLKGSALTVFADNEIALNWYQNMGYALTRNSPKNKILRNQKVIKPSYYLMRKSI
ncbi:NAT4 [Candida pseudojiufengensis]|uniref:NAT4 n=1 Tax=Candida pseudojiufengensis TaxID=497109 RepID=UPI0022242F75|nr:NAT4 [Candida pseudojiufengensis]KAI5965580.1 NAT4 [Candida pseudojiufengensis]